MRDYPQQTTVGGSSLQPSGILSNISTESISAKPHSDQNTDRCEERREQHGEGDHWYQPAVQWLC